MYSFVLKRIIHYICSLCLCLPTNRIYLCKVDLDAAYQRCHLSSSTAQESLTSYGNLLFMALRMTFGGAPCPALWGYISDTLADVCNCLIHNPHWNHIVLCVIPCQINLRLHIRFQMIYHSTMKCLCQ